MQVVSCKSAGTTYLRHVCRALQMLRSRTSLDWTGLRMLGGETRGDCKTRWKELQTEIQEHRRGGADICCLCRGEKHGCGCTRALFRWAQLDEALAKWPAQVLIFAELVLRGCRARLGIDENMKSHIDITACVDWCVRMAAWRGQRRL